MRTAASRCLSAPAPSSSVMLRHGASASSVLLSGVPRPAAALPPRRPCQQHLIWRPGQQIHHGAPCQRLLQGASASNKPHPAEKSTPVWLAIWHIWAGFANSQLLPDAAALSSIPDPPRSGNSSAQTSASLHPPAALRLRVLPFTRTWSSTVCAEEFPTPLEMFLHALHLSTGLLLLRQTQISRPICTDCLRHLRISAG